VRARFAGGLGFKGRELWEEYEGVGARLGAIAHDNVPSRCLQRPDYRPFGRPDPPNVSIYMDRAVINPKLHRLAGNEVKRPGWVVLGFEGWKENSRSLRLNDEAERRLSAVAEQPLKDIIVVMRDTGMRNARELYCMRVENMDFDAGTIFTPDSKTESGRRFIPVSSRVKQILEARTARRSEGWVWMSRYKGKYIGEGMVYRQGMRARQAAGLPRELVLYCARHDFGSFVLAKTGNLKAVMNAMGHGDVRSAMIY